MIQITASRDTQSAFSFRGQVYTVYVGSKRALFMLAIVALWAVLPGLACFAPATHHACCRQMTEACGSSMSAANPSCCKVHSSDSDMPPAQASQSEDTSLVAHLLVGAKLPFAPAEVSAAVQTFEDPPGPPAATRISILRI